MARVINFTSQRLIQSPGRVNLLGEHVDYNQGIVLPAAINRYVTVHAQPVIEPIVTLTALDLNGSVKFDLNEIEKKIDLTGQPLPGWALYPAAVAWVLKSRGFQVTGVQAEYTSDIPIGSGLSSSAAVEVAFAILWQSLGGWSLSRLEIARICQQAENEYVGVHCGLMDQFAVACGVEGHALRFDTRSLDYQPVPLPSGCAIIIADSGIRRSLTNSAYNDRRKACQQAVTIIQQYQPEVTSLRDISNEKLACYREKMPYLTYLRAKHVVDEIARVEDGVNYLQRGDPQSFGRLMTLAHQSLRDLYQVSIPELDFLVESAINLPGCYGSRLTGAGFGGCTVNLVAVEHAQSFIEQLAWSFQQNYHRQAAIYICTASQAASCLSV